MTGSASDAGLDGSKLALATNANVVIIQYRLGAVCDTLTRFSSSHDFISSVFSHPQVEAI